MPDYMILLYVLYVILYKETYKSLSTQGFLLFFCMLLLLLTVLKD